MYRAEVLAHSISEAGAEAFTFRLVIPRIILAEFNTHRKLAKNTSSSRAIPIKKMIEHARNNMFVPFYIGKNQPGMQANEELTGFRRNLAVKAWKFFGNSACFAASIMDKIGVHKQLSNRLIENFTYVTIIFTTTDLHNFLALRNHPDAQPEFKRAAELIEKAASQSTPKLLKVGEWHLPLIDEHERKTMDVEQLRLISAARCASTSYTTVDGKKIGIDAARRIADKLIKSNPIHASPFEHQLTPDVLVEIEYRVAKSKKKLQTAKVWKSPSMHGNTVGFIQHRKLFPNESANKDLTHFYQLSL